MSVGTLFFMAPARCARSRAARAESRCASSAALRCGGSGELRSGSSGAFARLGAGDGAAAGDGDLDTYTSTSVITINVVNTVARHLIGVWVTRRSTADGIGDHRKLIRSVVSVAPDSAARMLKSADCIWRAVS